MNLIKLIGKTVTYLTDVFHNLNRYECCLQRLNHAYLYRGIGAICVQRFDDSLNPAIHTTYRISLRSSSYSEPRDPSLSDVVCLKLRNLHSFQNQRSSIKKVLHSFLTGVGQCSPPSKTKKQPDR